MVLDTQTTDELKKTRKEATVTFFNSLKPNLVSVIFKNSVRNSKKTHPIRMATINLLMLFKEMIADNLTS
jgi:ribosomal protein L29